MDFAPPQTTGSVANSAANAQVPLVFSVSGTNRTLGRKVQFNGKLLLNQNQLSPDRVISNSQQQEGTALGNQVNGKMVVEGMPSQELEAMQVP